MASLINYPAPKYAKGERVWLRMSASIGILESYVVASVEFDEIAVPIYTLKVSNFPANHATGGDRNVFIKHLPLRLREPDLLSYLEALDVTIAHIQSELDRLTAIRQSLS